MTEGAHEALVSRENFERANAMLRHPQKTKRNPGGRRDAVFYCGHCGRKLRRTSGTEVCFVCDTPSYQSDAACRGLRWSKRELEQVLLPIYRVQLSLLGEKAMELELRRDDTQLEAAAFARRVGQLEREINGCRRQKMELFEAYHDGALDLTAYAGRKASLTERMDRLQAEYAEMEAGCQKANEEREKRKSDAAWITDFLSADDESDEAAASKMYEAIDRVLVMDRNHLEVRWRFADQMQYAGQ